jgi:hypothetical protein
MARNPVMAETPEWVNANTEIESGAFPARAGRLALGCVELFHDLLCQIDIDAERLAVL